MKGSRYSEEQIIGILREAEAGLKTAEVCRRHGIAEAALYKWKAKYGGMEWPTPSGLRGSKTRTGG
jgi:putative transposase